jgi:hypothetical protein
MVRSSVEVQLAKLRKAKEAIERSELEMLNEGEVGGVARSATGSAPSPAGEIKRWSAGRKKQIEFWGIDTSFAFVAERFNRALKKQVIQGRIFRTVEDVRAAVTELKGRYNRHWRLEKLGFMSPLEVRQSHAIQKTA